MNGTEVSRIGSSKSSIPSIKRCDIQSIKRGAAYRREFDRLPRGDHWDAEPECDIQIISWQANDDQVANHQCLWSSQEVTCEAAAFALGDELMQIGFVVIANLASLSLGIDQRLGISWPHCSFPI